MSSGEKGRMLNVPRRKTDEYYRYKMPDLVEKIEGKGNGIKTVIVNCEDIAKALARPASYICRYFGQTLAAASNTDSGKYVINGKHEYKDLMTALDKFIDKFVLCRKCENPETVMIVKNKTLTLHCKACGELTEVPKNEKLLKFIFMHPPKHDDRKDEEGEEETQQNVEEDKRKQYETNKVVITLHKKEGDPEVIEILGKDLDLETIVLGNTGNRLNAMLTAYKQCFRLSNKSLIKEMFDTVFDKDIFDTFTDKIDVFDLYLSDELNEKGMITFLEEFNIACAKYDLYTNEKLPNVLLYLYRGGYVTKKALQEWYDGGPVQMSPMKQKAKGFMEWVSDRNEDEDQSVEEEQQDTDEEEDEQ
ncbi:eukaryotic translation initiation factor, putative [Entamoeba invadens IP1]|uniref:Eukaryotic translation initiation factor, putative n=1 Tax=Entamoeba invadens IP1 TaxID=370355 RepID=A0A0A1U4M3_ENTIV|nr:eukaryotic translation initiation factor, putative [Entamoeba invadens IP1]ELP89207.1 eukaryotic translation initiation factor, putative [Entamoeba invadens IP1]|eukprot:XP_004255978.1 eukaryotic translation initiation factor, putative [Entamoeba invadens IP1]